MLHVGYVLASQVQCKQSQVHILTASSAVRHQISLTYNRKQLAETSLKLTATEYDQPRKSSALHSRDHNTEWNATAVYSVAVS